MKKLTLITLLLAFGITESIFGQFDLNISSGINYSDNEFEGFDAISPERRIGYFVGVAPNYQITEKIHFQVDVQYSIKGFEAVSLNSISPFEFRYEYIDIIPEIEFHILRYLGIGVGVNYGIKINEQFKIDNEDWIDPIVDSVSSSDFGLTGKLEGNFKNLFGFARYNTGLTDIAEIFFADENGEIIEDAKQVNRNLQIGVGYKLIF